MKTDFDAAFISPTLTVASFIFGSWLLPLKA